MKQLTLAKEGVPCSSDTKRVALTGDSSSFLLSLCFMYVRYLWNTLHHVAHHASRVPGVKSGSYKSDPTMLNGSTTGITSQALPAVALAQI
jgi:hypothetical protein